MKHSSLYIFVLMLAAACTPSVPKQYIQPGEMEDILFDYHVAQAMSKTTGSGDYEYNKQLYIDAVLKKYGISEADFDSSLVYLLHPCRQVSRYLCSCQRTPERRSQAFGRFSRRYQSLFAV